MACEEGEMERVPERPEGKPLGLASVFGVGGATNIGALLAEDDRLGTDMAASYERLVKNR
jgi:hypothetical protein